MEVERFERDREGGALPIGVDAMATHAFVFVDHRASTDGAGVLAGVERVLLIAQRIIESAGFFDRDAQLVGSLTEKCERGGLRGIARHFRESSVRLGDGSPCPTAAGLSTRQSKR